MDYWREMKRWLGAPRRGPCATRASLVKALVCLTLVACSGAHGQTPLAEGSITTDTTGHAKAKGVGVRIDFPRSWSVEEGKRPNTVFIAVSKQGRGLENCVLVVNTGEQLGWTSEKMQSETSESFGEATRLQRAAADSDQEFLDGGALGLESLPSRWFTGVNNSTRAFPGLVFASITFQLVFKERLLTLTCGTGAMGREDALEALQRNLVLFRRIANSLVIPSRW